MVHYAVGSFEPSRSGSPNQFVCKNLQPDGPYAILDAGHRRIHARVGTEVYLFELESWHSVDQNKQSVTQIIASLQDIRRALHEALQSAQWELAIEGGRTNVHIVGGLIKTKYGYFKPRYDNGTRPNGQDESPSIWIDACRASRENPYGDALGTALAQGHLICLDPVELKRAHDAGIAKKGLGELFRDHHGF